VLDASVLCKEPTVLVSTSTHRFEALGIPKLVLDELVSGELSRATGLPRGVTAELAAPKREAGQRAIGLDASRVQSVHDPR
jgi:hypothetical protein